MTSSNSGPPTNNATAEIISRPKPGTISEQDKQHPEKKQNDITRSPPGILALGAVLDHIVSCDCSCRHVNEVWNDGENDTLRLAYQHHAAAPNDKRQAGPIKSTTMAVV
jgi:hypothetical protein